MEALRILGEEHFWIARMLDCLQCVAAKAVEESDLDAASAEELLALFDSFADKRHQEKEEKHLFPRIRVHANAEQEEVVARLAADHGEEVGRMIRLRSTLFGALHGDAVSREEFGRLAGEYVTLERQHMTKERLEIFPMAERLLSAGDDKTLVAAFEKLDSRSGGAQDWVFARIRALCERLGVEVSRG